MKKFLALLLALVMLLSLAACGKKDPSVPEPLPDSSAEYPPEPNQNDDQQAQGWVEPAPTTDPEDDFLTNAISDLSSYVLSHCKASYLGQIKVLAGGASRHMFLYQPGQSPEDLQTLTDLENMLGISNEDISLRAIDRTMSDPALVQTIMTNYGTLYLYDFDVPLDTTKYAFQTKLTTQNAVVDDKLEVYDIGISGMVDLVMQPKIYTGSVDAYRISTNLWALPDTREFSFIERELNDLGTNELGEELIMRTNYSSEMSFLVWGVDEVPATAELTNISIEQYPYYEMHQPSIWQSPVMPSTYVICAFYDEGLVTPELDANDAYINARNAIETQFVVHWGQAAIPFSATPIEVPVDINQYIPS